mmetsp:Transcript_94449/g.281928  ORF Transcript_94449/g.281928 Transcript_94449/m.281928 type:complete len:162 (+) Transcript_94449:134-619(+)
MPVEMAGSPDKNCMRSSSEYVKSPAQQASKFLKQQALKPQAQDQYDAKLFLKAKEAQGLVNIFRDRVEGTLDEDFSEWTVVDYKGDLTKWCIAKVRVSQEDDFVHIFALKPSKSEPWTCRYAANKTQSHELETAEDDYSSLPEPYERCSQMDGACSVCSVM